MLYNTDDILIFKKLASSPKAENQRLIYVFVIVVAAAAITVVYSGSQITGNKCFHLRGTTN